MPRLGAGSARRWHRLCRHAHTRMHHLGCALLFCAAPAQTSMSRVWPDSSAAMQVFEGRVVDSDNRSGGHVITATAGSGANKQTFNYATERVVGNGSFGTVFQATCLETAETVRPLQLCVCAKLRLLRWQQRAASCPTLAAALLIGSHRVPMHMPRLQAWAFRLVSKGRRHCWPPGCTNTCRAVRPCCSAVLCCIERRWQSRRCCRTSASRTASCRS